MAIVSSRPPLDETLIQMKSLIFCSCDDASHRIARWSRSGFWSTTKNGRRRNRIQLRRVFVVGVVAVSLCPIRRSILFFFGPHARRVHPRRSSSCFYFRFHWLWRILVCLVSINLLLIEIIKCYFFLHRSDRSPVRSIHSYTHNSLTHNSLAKVESNFVSSFFFFFFWKWNFLSFVVGARNGNVLSFRETLLLSSHDNRNCNTEPKEIARSIGRL